MTPESYDSGGAIIVLLGFFGLVLCAIHTPWWLPFSVAMIVWGLCCFHRADKIRGGE